MKMKIRLCDNKTAKKVMKSTKKLFAVTWAGGGDGEIDIVDFDELKGTDNGWDFSDTDFLGNGDFLKRLDNLEFGQSLIYDNLTQQVAFMRLADGATD